MCGHETRAERGQALTFLYAHTCCCAPILTRECCCAFDFLYTRVSMCSYCGVLSFLFVRVCCWALASCWGLYLSKDHKDGLLS
jgi:hypothetical protein